MNVITATYADHTLNLGQGNVYGADLVDLLFLGRNVPVIKDGMEVGSMHRDGNYFHIAISGTSYARVRADWIESMILLQAPKINEIFIPEAS